MANVDWHLVGFSLTVVAACTLWVLAHSVYRTKPESYMHQVFALSMVFMGLWFLGGFAERVLTTPSDLFTLWTYRWSYSMGIMSSIFFLLFTISFDRGHKPGTAIRMPILLAGIASALLCVSPQVIKSVSYVEGTSRSQNGQLFGFAEAMILLPSLAGVYFMTRAWSRSAGIERARTSAVLYGIVIFVPLVAILIFVLPAIFSNDVTTGYAFLIGLLPVGFTAYSVVRLRLLETQPISDKISTTAVLMLLLTVVFALLYLLFSRIHASNTVQYSTLLLLLIAVIALSRTIGSRAATSINRRFLNNGTSQRELLVRLTTAMSGNPDARSGLLAAVSALVVSLKLRFASLILPPGVLDGRCYSFECALTAGGESQNRYSDNNQQVGWLYSVRRMVRTDDLRRWPANDDEMALAEGLTAAHLSGCIPIPLPAKKTCYLLVGEKVSNKPAGSSDMALLDKCAENLGLFVDNYALSARLAERLLELERAYLDLHSAFEFRSEVVKVASHEFRTPVAVINACASLLINRGSELEEDEKAKCLDSITRASRRLVNLTDKFLIISKLEAEHIDPVFIRTSLGEVIASLKADLSAEDVTRLVVEGNLDQYVLSDPEYLEVMLLNIIENALRFSPEYMSVVLRCWCEKSVVYLEIGDSGGGIPFEEREKVFEPFVRLEDIIHHSRGMGLGLHIVSLLSSRLRVVVDIESTSNEGTKVTLSFNRLE